MCGILGWFGSVGDSPAAESWAAALGRLAHRGPDGEGSWTDSFATPNGPCKVSLGHRRLAIVDTSNAAAQPMISPHTGIVLIFNGQIYNFEELRSQVGDWPYKGHGDTEVLLAALDRWGVDAVDRLRGMYAFAWWDPRSRTLGLARDRLGVKPLYVAEPKPGTLAFGSETRAVCGLLPSTPPISPAGLSDFITWGSVQEPHTIWQGLKALGPGRVAIWNGNRLIERVYWDSRRFVGQRGRRPDEVRGAVAEAVRMRLVSDVPLGVFLSSGVDSCVVAYEASRAVPHVRTLTLGFSNDQTDESQEAAETARSLGLQHEIITYAPNEIPTLFDAFVSAQDQPSVDGLNTWLISRAARSAGFKVMLSGLGGDELFFGYSNFLRTRLGLFRPHPALAAVLGRWLRKRGENPERLEAIWSARSFLEAAPWIRAFWGPRALDRIGLLPQIPRLPTLPPVPAEEQLSWFELRHYLLNTLLRDSDVMSMSHGLELRVPFMDHRLVELALSLPASDRWGPGVETKYLLKSAYAADLPRNILHRRKRGFFLPFDRWLSGELRNDVEAAYADLAKSGILPAAHLTRVRELRASGKLHWTRVFQLLILHRWLEQERSLRRHRAAA